ncbi:hypothetical protein ACF1GT_18290 [Streptomyces sp. NPDC014636]|uniref:hypothetical protein n=1 Tax=Streptomyces sp. NPDC014636 TaxID=3364876 RepID=UPI0036FA5051
MCRFEPTGLAALKEEVARRWGVLDLLDVLKNADFLTGFTEEFTSVAAYERTGVFEGSEGSSGRVC